MSGTKDGTRILAAILSKQGDLEVLASDLLRAFREGFSIESDLVKIGAWIQSELGAYGRPLVQCLLPLLRHKLKSVRFFTVESVMSCATADDCALVAAAVGLIDDPESSVRWKVIQFHTTLP